MKDAIVIGAGFSGLSAACYLARAGYKVTVLEKNATPGGRARQFSDKGFTFDMGPTFYWMPEIFERFFADFNRKPSDYYQLTRLDPSYQVYFSATEQYKLSARYELLLETFEKAQAGSSRFLKRFLKNAELYYDAALNDIIYRPGKSVWELINWKTISNLRAFTTSLSHEIRKHIKNDHLARILEFPVLFLGAQPSDTPLFYALMNYADIKGGTWHVHGGMYSVIQGLIQFSKELGVEIQTQAPVDSILNEAGKATGVMVGKTKLHADRIISTADYQHTETLLNREYRNYSSRYWNKKVFAPSALLFYAGFDKKLQNVSHHTLFFDTDFSPHAQAIYKNPAWPEKPLFYASFPSITDASLAPEGKECGIFLIPTATGLDQDTDERRKHYFQEIIARMEQVTGQTIRDSILFHHAYGLTNFKNDYHAFQGNAYGLANILRQTAFMRPSVKSKKLSNLYYAGHLTVPGPGVPPALISGKIAAELAISNS